MRIAFGLKAHSGWAALVAIGESGGEGGAWAKQPYHAAEGRPRAEAHRIVASGIESADREALRAMQEALATARAAAHRIVGCALLAVEPMPGWTVDEILAVHFRMHKAEGVLFREALARAATGCGLPLIAVPEKQLLAQAERDLGAPAPALAARVAALGKKAGPPWGKDQKDAALSAMMVLRAEPR